MLTLRFFAETADRMGDRQREVPWRASPAELVDSLPELAPLRKQSHLRVAVNLEWADWTTPLKDGDEVAFLPPVSGG